MWCVFTALSSPSPLLPLGSPCLTPIKLNLFWKARIAMGPETCAAWAQEGRESWFKEGFSGIVGKRSWNRHFQVDNHSNIVWMSRSWYVLDRITTSSTFYGLNGLREGKKKRHKETEHLGFFLCFGLVGTLQEVWRFSKSPNTPQQSTETSNKGWNVIQQDYRVQI